jgi:hypothetical protein
MVGPIRTPQRVTSKALREPLRSEFPMPTKTSARLVDAAEKPWAPNLKPHLLPHRPSFQETPKARALGAMPATRENLPVFINALHANSDYKWWKPDERLSAFYDDYIEISGINGRTTEVLWRDLNAPSKEPICRYLEVDISDPNPDNFKIKIKSSSDRKPSTYLLKDAPRYVQQATCELLQRTSVATSNPISHIRMFIRGGFL